MLKNFTGLLNRKHSRGPADDCPLAGDTLEQGGSRLALGCAYNSLNSSTRRPSVVGNVPLFAAFRTTPKSLKLVVPFGGISPLPVHDNGTHLPSPGTQRAVEHDKAEEGKSAAETQDMRRLSMGSDAPSPTPELLKGLLEDARDAARSDGNTYGTARGEANLGYVPQILRNLGYVPLGHGSASAPPTSTTLVVLAEKL